MKKETLFWPCEDCKQDFAQDNATGGENELSPSQGKDSKGEGTQSRGAEGGGPAVPDCSEETSG